LNKGQERQARQHRCQHAATARSGKSDLHSEANNRNPQDVQQTRKKLAIIIIIIIKNNIIIIIRTFPECFAPEKFQYKIT